MSEIFFSWYCGILEALQNSVNQPFPNSDVSWCITMQYKEFMKKIQDSQGIWMWHDIRY